MIIIIILQGLIDNLTAIIIYIISLIIIIKMSISIVISMIIHMVVDTVVVQIFALNQFRCCSYFLFLSGFLFR